jgi:hypothetical protein
VLHRVSDLSAAGAAGSEQVAVAEGLLADSETRVLYAQAPGEVTGAATLLGMTSTEAELLSRLGRGVALWKVGTRSFLVQHRLSPGERALVDTDARMVAPDEGASAPWPPVPAAPRMRRDEWPPPAPVRLAPTGT